MQRMMERIIESLLVLKEMISSSKIFSSSRSCDFSFRIKIPNPINKRTLTQP